jgi:predicted NUDIX family phosphoesterase
MSIGLGGHIDFSDIIRTGGDINLPETLEAAAHRELAEELGELDCLSRSWIGGIVDNETSVGRVHVGIVGLWSIPTFPDGMQEDTIGQICLKSIDELNSIDDHLETWSAMLLPHLQNIMTENSIEP